MGYPRKSTLPTIVGALVAANAVATASASASARSETKLRRFSSSSYGNSILLSAADETALFSRGFIATGKNARSPTEDQVWVGDDGNYTNEFMNRSAEHLILVLWGPDASWVNVHQPLITISLPAGARETLSFASGTSGAWAGVYDSTGLVDGQVSETWGEYTLGEQGCVDVSREVNMLGHNMTIETGGCVSDMDTCIFKCKDGAVTCWLEYELVNCENGSQPGAIYGIHDGAPSGGCGGIGATAQIETVFQ